MIWGHSACYFACRFRYSCVMFSEQVVDSPFTPFRFVPNFLCNLKPKVPKEYPRMFSIIDFSSGFTEIRRGKEREFAKRRRNRRESDNVFIPYFSFRGPRILSCFEDTFLIFTVFGSFDVKRLETFSGQTICSCNAVGYFLTP
jgi:hypothetical protein